MLKSRRLIWSFCLVLLGFAATAAAQDLFPDKNLEAAVRQQVFEKRGKPEPLVDLKFRQQDRRSALVAQRIAPKIIGFKTSEKIGRQHALASGEADFLRNLVQARRAKLAVEIACIVDNAVIVM